MWILRWEFFVVGALWTLASVMFKRAGAGGATARQSIAAGIGLLVAGIALLIVRFGLQGH